MFRLGQSNSIFVPLLFGREQDKGTTKDTKSTKGKNFLHKVHKEHIDKKKSFL
jgi:hypothetical protein